MRKEIKIANTSGIRIASRELLQLQSDKKKLHFQQLGLVQINVDVAIRCDTNHLFYICFVFVFCICICIRMSNGIEKYLHHIIIQTMQVI